MSAASAAHASDLPTTEELDEIFRRVNNWTRWGVSDERGALNHLTGEHRARAAALVRTAQRARPQVVLAEVSEDHTAAGEAFERLGFEADQTMHRLALRLKGGG